MSQLLKYARAKDDVDFVWRISAALTVRAQEIQGWELEPASTSLVSWVLSNPMAPIPRMVAHVSTSPAVAANIAVEGGTIDTSAVPDGDIQFTVNTAWDAVAEYLYPAAPVKP